MNIREEIPPPEYWNNRLENLHKKMEEKQKKHPYGLISKRKRKRKKS